MERITCELVHKNNPENVFLLNQSRAGTRDGLECFHTTFDFPLAHVTYSDAATGLSASGYIVEVGRQANLAISHHFFGAPLNSGFIVTSMGFEFVPSLPFVPTDNGIHTIETTIVEAQKRNGMLIKLVTRTTIAAPDGSVYFYGNAGFLISSRTLTGSRKAGLESKGALEGPFPAEVITLKPTGPDLSEVIGLENPINRLIGTPTIEHEHTVYPFLTHREHPCFFEHENAHLPGMMLLEAAKQAAVHAAGLRFPPARGLFGDLIQGDILFRRFGDLDKPLSISCRFGSIEEHQGGLCARVEIEFLQRARSIGIVHGTVGFIDADTAVSSSALVRRRMDLVLENAHWAEPMHGAF